MDVTISKISIKTRASCYSSCEYVSLRDRNSTFNRQHRLLSNNNIVDAFFKPMQKDVIMQGLCKGNEIIIQ